MSNQESKLLALKILQWLSSGFGQLFNYFSLGVATVFLIYAAKVNHINISWASDFVTSAIELLLVAFIGTFVIALFYSSKTLSNFNSKLVDLMCKLVYVLWLVNDYSGLSATAINDKSQSLIIALIIVFVAKWLFNFACNYYGNVLLDECIDLDYNKLKDYKVIDSFIADSYKDVTVESQSLTVTRDGKGTITNASGYVTFKVAKLPVTLTFEVSPYVVGTLVRDGEYALANHYVCIEPTNLAKLSKKTIKL